jgi:hypothetical protein
VQNQSEVTFVYIGKRLPKYAEKSLGIAREFSGQKVQVVGNNAIHKEVKDNSVAFVAIEDFYSSTDFIAASKFLSGDSHFRNGLWFRSLERFFVLEQYMHYRNLNKFFHAELDQVLFRTDILEAKLSDLSYSGLYLPFHAPDAAVASVVFCNSKSVLKSFLDFTCSGSIFLNEMQLLSAWAKVNPQLVFELPTPASEINERRESLIPNARLLSISETGGLVDAAQLGQWVAGIDPRNVPIYKKPTNKFIGAKNTFALSQNQLSQISCKFNVNSRLLTLLLKDKSIATMFNLHLHSKIHSTTMSTVIGMQNFLDLANLSYPIRFKGTRKIQVMDYFITRSRIVLKNPVRFLTYSLRRAYSELNHNFVQKFRFK